MLRITNTQPGPRGVNAVAGPVLIEPGETREVEAYAREREHIKATRWFDVEGSFAKDPDPAAESKVTVDMDQSAKETIAALTADVGALRGEIAQLQDGANKQALADRNARIADLEAQLAAKAEAAKTEGGAKGAK